MWKCSDDKKGNERAWCRGLCVRGVTISSDNVPSYFCLVSMLFEAGMSCLIQLPVRAAPSLIHLLGQGEGSWAGLGEGVQMSSAGRSVISPM